MSEALIVSVEHAASLAASNVSSGKYWAKCPSGKVMRLKSIAWFVYGTGGIASDIPVATTFKIEAKIDQRPILNMPYGTSYLHAASSTNYQRGVSTPLEAMIPVNDILLPSEELNLYVTSPANGQGHIYCIMELVDLAEIQAAMGRR